MEKILLFCCLLYTSIAVANPVAPDDIATKINTLLKNYSDTVSIGILVTDPKTGKIIYQRDADRYFMPASNEKLFTATAALALLNEDFTYKTQLFADVSKIQNGVLNDNIYLRFSGDPTLILGQLDYLAASLGKAGVKEIKGNIIIDDSAFDQMAMSPGSTWDDKDYCWGSPINAITVDHNCVKATLFPANIAAKPANLILPPMPQSLQFINTAMTQPANFADCIIQTKRTSPKDYTISGCINVLAQPKAIEMAIDDPRANIQYLLTYILIKKHILSSFHFEYKKIDASAKLLGTIASQPLPVLITTMLKESDNTIANSLFKTMGSLYAKDVGTFQNGSEAVRNVLNQSLQIAIPKTTLIDGSGTSRYDFVTPQQIVTLLQKMYASKHASVFMQALPVAGVDGTLKDRMQNVTTQGKVFAKTGSETAVSTLSGYLETRNNNTLAFSIMINGFVDLPTRYQELEDKICAALIENG
jgi:serine-type D-Ala-D-Ala carboxypeptidase/endopeptidase (penicillin-binding protein 4)